MSPLLTAAFFIGELIAIVLIALAFHQRGYQHGHDTGYKKGKEFGHREANNWWYGAEADIEMARAKIWREELLR